MSAQQKTSGVESVFTLTYEIDGEQTAGMRGRRDRAVPVTTAPSARLSVE